MQLPEHIIENIKSDKVRLRDLKDKVVSVKETIRGKEADLYEAMKIMNLLKIQGYTLASLKKKFDEQKPKVTKEMKEKLKKARIQVMTTRLGVPSVDAEKSYDQIMSMKIEDILDIMSEQNSDSDESDY